MMLIQVWPIRATGKDTKRGRQAGFEPEGETRQCVPGEILRAIETESGDWERGCVVWALCLLVGPGARELM